MGTIIHVHGLAELGIEECLLSGEHFEIVGLAVVHQFMGAQMAVLRCPNGFA